MKLYFVTANQYKADEARDYFNNMKGQSSLLNIDLSILKHQVQEILHDKIDVIVKDKTLKAYEYLGVPCVVEQSGIFMDALPGLPGGVGQIVWDAVGDRMCSFLREGDSRAATAKSVIGYCDGRRVRVYWGKTQGQIAEGARGDYKFNWDPIFIPEGTDKTYGEMGIENKRASSPFIKAWDAFLKAEFLNYQK